jgi:predicted DNA-binding protein YlxM (UPF0122 family)
MGYIKNHPLIEAELKAGKKRAKKMAIRSKAIKKGKEKLAPVAKKLKTFGKIANKSRVFSQLQKTYKAIKS